MSDTAIMDVATDLGKGLVINYNKRKLATICINTCAYILSPARVIFINSSKIVK